MTHTRVTACIQTETDNIIRQARLVDHAELESIERVFKTFRIEYEVDEIRADTRLYSLSVTLRDANISGELLTREELTDLLAPYLGKGRPIEQADLKLLLKGKIPEICKSVPGGEIVAGYELTVKGGEAAPGFRFPRLGFGRKKAGKGEVIEEKGAAKNGEKK
jgi:hypothetical protein